MLVYTYCTQHAAFASDAVIGGKVSKQKEDNIRHVAAEHIFFFSLI